MTRVVHLRDLSPGDSFALLGESVTGTLVRLGSGSATVKLDGGERDVEFKDRQGNERSFHAVKTYRADWSRETLVEVKE